MHNLLETESEYPYIAKNQKCKATVNALEGVQITGFKEVKRHDPTELATALTLGPVSIGVDAGSRGFQFYKKGIIKRNCGSEIDHAVLLVGYGSDKGVDYWLVKNSWSEKWGESGYLRILRDMSKADEGMCGIQQTPTYPIV